MASDPWNGMPENPERDSKGHVLRVDGRIDVYRWDAKDQWFKDGKDRWVSPLDLVKDGDEYLGHIITPADLAAAVEAAVQAERAIMREAEKRIAPFYGLRMDNPPPGVDPSAWRKALQGATHAGMLLTPLPDTAALAAALAKAREEALREAAEIAASEWDNNDEGASSFDGGGGSLAWMACCKKIEAAIRALAGKEQGK